MLKEEFEKEIIKLVEKLELAKNNHFTNIYYFKYKNHKVRLMVEIEY